MTGSDRKKEHVDIVLGQDVRPAHNFWDDISLLHEALPEVDLDEVDTRMKFLGKELSAPLIISSMTGGFADAKTINANLAYGAAEVGVGMGVGSQRPALQGRAPEDSFAVVRDFDIPLVIANVGAPQLIKQGEKPPLGLGDARKAMAMVDADILAVHLNFTQEVVQPEGDRRARGCLEALRTMASELPVLAKETGAGISRRTAQALKDAGVKAIDVGGLGGTSFSAVEYYRAQKEGHAAKERLGKTFWEWGIPTPVSLLLAAVGLPLVATGGVRNGLDAARALNLGATCAGMASTMLRAAMASREAVVGELNAVIAELKATLFLTGCATAADLARKPRIVKGPSADWMRALGVNP
jgi:isopentenyl-diphosphate delta-isomerase